MNEIVSELRKRLSVLKGEVEFDSIKEDTYFRRFHIAYRVPYDTTCHQMTVDYRHDMTVDEVITIFKSEVHDRLMDMESHICDVAHSLMRENL